MKRTNLYSIAAIAAFALISCGEGVEHADNHQSDATNNEQAIEESVTSNINLTNSKVMWKGEMLGLYSHEGVVNFTEGSIEHSNGQVSGGSFTIDMTSIQPTDENYDPTSGNTPEKLVGHLSSPDFFDVANHAVSKFVITGGSGSTLSGDLTLRGVTHQETVENVVYDAATNSWTGEMVVDRKKYDVSFDMPVADKVLSNDLILKINLTI